ncbi:tyrosine-protein phosphatase [Luteimonas sp. MC1828]|nr:tyrosine-protein phosphatase [Luteimonas sp. MC1828]
MALALSACTTTESAPAAPAQDEVTMQSPLLERFTTPAEGIHAGGRITADDLPALRAAGIRHVIDLTPDSETPGFDEAGAVRAAGMGYDNLPIAGPDDLDREAVVAFDQLLRAADGPTLVHCASGNRVGALAALRAAWLQGADADAAVEEGRRWGLRGLEDAVRERLAR